MTETAPRQTDARTDALRRTALVVAVALLVALVVVVLVAGLPALPRLRRLPRFAFLLRVKLFVTTFNVVVLGALAATYVSVYRDMPNRFTFSLVLFTAALLAYAVTSNPLVPYALGFRGSVELGPFTFIPDLFASVAAVVLFHQSNE